MILCYLETSPKETGGGYYSHAERTIFQNRSTEVWSSRSELNISIPDTFNRVIWH